jgi:hypothetical protein
MVPDATIEPRQETAAMNENTQPVVVVDLRIPFIRLVLFFVKAALAAIPAAIIVGALIMLATAIVAALIGDGGFVVRRWSSF